MTHEPECEIAMSGVNVNDCICGYVNHAYQRGREDAAKAVATETCHTKECDFDRAEGLICYCGYETSIAAARGDDKNV